MQLGKRNRDRLATVRSHCKTIAWLTEFAEDPERSEDSFKSELDDAINRLDSLVDLLSYVRNYPEEGIRKKEQRAKSRWVQCSKCGDLFNREWSDSCRRCSPLKAKNRV
jgi:hypothetical protein